MRAADELAAFRQVAVLDTRGTTAQWTGEHRIRCVAGENWAAQGNMLAAEAWHAMGAAFQATNGTLADRLLAALEAAEDAGGDFRGRGGAGIVVVAAEGEPWERVIDLRVEDGDDSLVQLRRLVELAQAYRRTNRAEPAAPLAAELGLPPSRVRLLALMDAARAGDVDGGRRILAELELEHPHWRDTAHMLALLPDAAPALRDIVGKG